MRYIVLGVLLYTSFMYGVPVFTPVEEIDVNGTVKDMVLKDNQLLIATDNGMVQVYDNDKKLFIKDIILPKVKDFAGDEVLPRIFSVDKMAQRYLLLSDSGKGGYVNLWIHENNETKQLIKSEDRIAAIKARFIDKNSILLGLLSNEAVLYDVLKKKELFRVQLSESKFSDFALNEEKTQAVFSCESGVLNVIDTKTGKVLKVLKGQNVDNVYKVDFKQGIISAAGQDRRGALYDIVTEKGTYLEGHFLIYATGLSPSAKKVAFSMDEQNNISIYSRSSKAKIAELKGQKSTLNTILFKDESTLFSSSDDDTVMIWKLN
ncbi:MAG: WD40 repeat domain-containing protein [Sulfurovum sp.]|nr:WD40 repeat domain-containing protein [Sulfurovum sp.]